MIGLEGQTVARQNEWTQPQGTFLGDCEVNNVSRRGQSNERREHREYDIFCMDLNERLSVSGYTHCVGPRLDRALLLSLVIRQTVHDCSLGPRTTLPLSLC